LTTLIRGYVEDLAGTTMTHVEARWVLKVLDNLVTWTSRKVKTKKSRMLNSKHGFTYMDYF